MKGKVMILTNLEPRKMPGSIILKIKIFINKKKLIIH